MEGKEDALQCEGNCLMWMHRYCAGVSLRHFKHLSSSSEPFVCMLCSQQVHRATVCQLQSEVAALKAEVAELRSVVRATPSNTDTSDTIAALASEVQQLKVAMADAPSLCLQEQNPASSLPWNKVVRRKRKPKSAQPPKQPAQGIATKQGAHGPLTGGKDGGEPGVSQPPRKARVQVSGARKVWGTLKHTPVEAVSNALKTLTDIPLVSLTIKRKYKTVHKNSRQSVVRWWFVVRGEERILQELQGKWGPVATQTSWKLEPLLEFEKTNPATPLSESTLETSSTPTDGSPENVQANVHNSHQLPTVQANNQPTVPNQSVPSSLSSAEQSSTVSQHSSDASLLPNATEAQSDSN